MDIVKQKPKSYLTKKHIYLLVGLVFIALITVAKASFNQVTLSKKNLLIATVKQGDLAITIDGYGKLVSEKLQLITTMSKATVQEIVLKPGAIVSADSVIVKLANPELTIGLASAEQELSQLNANLRQLKVNQQRELLTEQAILAELKSHYESAKLKRVAEQKLVKDGIVSDITFKQSQLNENQLNERIGILTQRLNQLSFVHKEAVNIQIERIKQQQGKLAIAQDLLEKLTVKAGFDGVLQRLSVNLGQSLSPGQEVALIGSTKELIAEIKVPQNQAPLVELGQRVMIDTRQATIEGVVSRIDPIVADNTVQIDIKLPETLPNSARPEQNIDAQITAKTLKNVNYIERPANVKAQTAQALYQLNSEFTLAQRKQVTLGEKTNRFIELVGTYQQGDKFIISDLSNYQAEEIQIN